MLSDNHRFGLNDGSENLPPPGNGGPQNGDIMVVEGQLLRYENAPNHLSKDGVYRYFSKLSFSTRTGVVNISHVLVASELLNLIQGASAFYVVKFSNEYFICAVRRPNGEIVQGIRRFMHRMRNGTIGVFIVGLILTAIGVFFIGGGVQSHLGAVIFIGVAGCLLGGLCLTVARQPGKAQATVERLKERLRQDGWREDTGGNITWK